MVGRGWGSVGLFYCLMLSGLSSLLNIIAILERKKYTEGGKHRRR
jgi:hypothetical protein